MYVKRELLEDPAGNLLFSVVQDNTEHAKGVQAENEENGGWTEERTMKKMMSVPPYVYYEWVDKLGPECWQDKEFLKFFQKHRPEFCY